MIKDIEKMNTDYARTKIHVLGTINEITSEEHNIDSISITMGCSDGDSIGVGCVYIPTCTVVMDETEMINNSSVFSVYFEIEQKWKEFGIFYVSGPISYSGGKMTISSQGQIGAKGDLLIEKKDFYLLNRNTFIYEWLEYISDLVYWKGQGRNIYPTIEDGSFRNKKLTSLWRKISEGGEMEWEDGNGGYKNTFITVRDALAGIAILFGGNVVEKFGNLWLVPKQGSYVNENGEYTWSASYDAGDCDSSFEYSRESYGIKTISLSKMPYSLQAINTSSGKENYFAYYGTEREEKFMLISQGNNGAGINYTQNIECDWISYGADILGPCFVQGDLVYNSGKFTFVGYSEKLEPGEMVRIFLDETRYIKIVVGEITINWDGGFTTEIRCDCNVKGDGSIASSSTAGSSVSSSVVTSGMINYGNLSYANTTLSNVHASEGFIGSLTSSEIFTNSLVANEAFIEDLQTKTVTAEAIKAATAEVGYLTAEEADLKYAEIDLANIKDGCITNAKIQNATIAFEKVGKSFVGDLTANTAFAEFLRAYVASFGYLDAEKADLKYADITFGNIDTANINVAEVAKLFTKVGLIDRATISEGHITGFLDAVEVNANKITAGTLIADRLLLRGSRNGLLYQLNNLGELTSQNLNSLDGTVLTKRTISADKLIAKSITANEIDVTNLFAQNITASGTITGATLYGAYAEITNGRVGIFDITQYALTFDNGTNKSTLDRAGLTVGLSYGSTVASGNYTTYGATGIKCRYSTIGDYVFNIDTGTSGAVELTGSLVPAAGGASRIGAELIPFETAYIKTIKTNSGNLTLQAGGNVVIGQQSLYLNDGKYNRAVLATFDDGDSANYGAELCVGTGGNTFVGSGESATLLRSDFQKGVNAGETYGRTGERLYLSSDETVYIYSNCNQIGSRKGIAYDYAGHLRPLLGQNSDLGTSVCPWNSAVIKEIHVSKFGLATGALGASNCTLEESHLFRIGNIVFLHVVFNSAYATSGWTRFINIPDGFRPKSLQHDNVITNSGEAAITQINPGGFLQVNWYPGFGGIRFTTCYVSS